MGVYMQKLLGFSSQLATRALVDNEREILLFMHSLLKQKGAGSEADDYSEFVPVLQAEVQSKFSPNLRVRAIDVQTARDSDDMASAVKIIVESTTYGVQ